MDVPKYLQVLWASKWLLLVGALVAAVAAFFAGFTIVDGKIESRAEQQYTAETTLLVSSPSTNMYQAVIPGQALVEGQTLPEETDLTSKAILYAYIVSGSEMRDRVESQLGAFGDTEALTALRRTTQPGGDEAFPGRYTLPIIAVVGASTDPDRAESISDTAAQLFMADVVSEQDASKIPDNDRVVVTVLDAPTATAVDGSNPAIPIAITFVGVFLVFVAAAFIIAGARGSRARKKAAAAEAAASEQDEEPATDTAEDAAALSDAGAPSTRRARSRTSEPVGDADATPDEMASPDHEPSYTP